VALSRNYKCGTYESVKEGWDKYYWEPLKEMLEK